MRSTSNRNTGRPQLIQAVMDAVRVPDLRKRLLFTFGLLVIFRFIAHVPMPGVDLLALDRLFQSNQLLGLLDLFSGGAMRNLSVAALGVYPYITASIIMQLMIPVFPGLSGLAQEGEAGRAKISQYTHWATIPLALAQGYAQLVLLSSAGTLDPLFPYPGGSFLQTLAMVISLAAGTMLLVWIGELITENGIGNGISLIIFGGIVAGLPGMAGQGLLVGDPTGLLLFGIIGFAMLYVIVVFTEAQRRIPVQYGRSVQRGGRLERQGSQTHIPLRVNSAGMIPLIFSFSIMIFPGTVAGYFVNADNNVVSGVADFMQRLFFTTSPVYWILLFLLTVGFAFFYTLITFQQQNLAENLQQSGGFIPGIRPGPPTAQYLNRVIMRITWGGAIFLGAIAVVPFIATLITNVETLTLSSTALLIVVGVTLDTMRQLEAQLLMRQYEGFI